MFSLKCGMIESWGRGFEKIANYCAEESANLPEIDLSLGGVTARCFASDFYLGLIREHNLGTDEAIMKDKMSNKMSNKEQERITKIIEYLKKYKVIIKSEAAELLKIEDKTAQRLLVKAVELKILDSEGNNKGKIYKLKID